jgi:hypothetical protein
MNIALQPAAEMRSRLLAIVKAENTFDFALQLVGQTNRPLAAAIGAAIMFNLLEIDSQGLVERLDGAAQNHAAPWGTFLNHREAVLTGEFLHRLHIVRVGTELLREILALEVFRWAACLVKPLDPLMQGVAFAVSQQDRHFETLVRIGLAQ